MRPSFDSERTSFAPFGLRQVCDQLARQSQLRVLARHQTPNLRAFLLNDIGYNDAIGPIVEAAGQNAFRIQADQNETPVLGPWHHLTASMLRNSSASLAEIASRVGYGSEAALSRAFKRWVGVVPASYRRGESPAPPHA